MITAVHKSIFEEFWHVIVPYGFNNDWEKVCEIRDWCRANFEKGQWGREDLHTESNFILYNEKDVMLFVLRWS